MDPPVCRTCGNKHWSRLCDGVTKRVTSGPAVTKPVTPVPPLTPDQVEYLKGCEAKPYDPSVVIGGPKENPCAKISDNRRLVAEVERLTAEVAALKRELASARKPPMTDAERARNLRKRRKHSPV